jgi:pimeloyl-ACP methyl ester carboxylesterase
MKLARLAVVAVLFAGCATGSAPRAPAFAVSVVGQGPPVIFIPGLGGAGQVWSSTVEKLQQRHTCHVLTLAGFAGQAPIEAPVLPQVREAIARYITDERLARPVIVGHSLGGFLAVDLAARHPELPGPLVIVDALPFLPAATDPTATPESVRPQAEALRRQLRDTPTTQLREIERQTLRTMIRDEDKIELALDWFMRSDPNTLGETVLEMMTTDLRPALPRVASPALVIGTWVAMSSFVTRAHVEALFRAQYGGLATWQFVMAEKAKHFVMLDDPDFLVAAIQSFIGAHPGTPLGSSPK